MAPATPITPLTDDVESARHRLRANHFANPALVVNCDSSFSSAWFDQVSWCDLEEGTDIEFDIEQAPKGPCATNVVRA